MTIDEFIEREKHSMQRSAEFAREHIKEMKSANKRYLRIREVISKWNPPTTSHEGLKEFALEQIDKSIYSEDYFSWSEKKSLSVQIPCEVKKNGTTYSMNTLKQQKKMLKEQKSIMMMLWNSHCTREF